MRARKRPRAANVASSTAPASAGTRRAARRPSAGRRRARAVADAARPRARRRTRGCGGRRRSARRPRRLERAGEDGQGAAVELHPHAAARGHLVRVAQQPEAGHVGDGVRLERPQRVGRGGVQRPHPGPRPPARRPVGRRRACACSTSPVPSGFVRKSASPGCAPALGQTPSGCTVPTTARPYFGSSSRSVCPPARSAPAARDLLVGTGEDGRDRLGRSSSGKPPPRARAAASRPSRTRR